MPVARDGHRFPTEIQKRKYEQSLDEEAPTLADRSQADFDAAPSGNPMREGRRHGEVVEHHYRRLPDGSHEVRVKHADGHEWSQVHAAESEAYLDSLHGAHDLEARAQETGEREAEPEGEDHAEIS